MIDLDEIRARSLAQGLLIDREAVATRVLKGDVYFSEVVVLVALVKSNDSTRRSILDVLGRKHFVVHARIFDWWAAAMREGEVLPESMYARMEEYVRQAVAPEYQEDLAQVLKSASPTSEAVDRTIAWLGRIAEVGRADTNVEEEDYEDDVLAILVAADDVSRARLMEALDRAWEAGVEPVIGIDGRWIVRWLVASVRAKGRVDEAYVWGQFEEFVAGPLLDNMNQLLDRIFAMDDPDDTVLDSAITQLQRYARERQENLR